MEMVREIKLVYGGRKKKAVKMSTPKSVEDFLSKYKDETKEHVIVLNLNNKNVLQSWNVVSIGTMSESIVHPREVFISAIHDNASAIILAHNHPSGVSSPSGEDRSCTSRIKQAGELIGIPLLDHVIIAAKGYYSFKEEGIL